MSKFYGVDNIGQNFLINQLEMNIKSYLDSGFLNAGGFVNVHKPVQNIHNNGLYKLYPVDNPNYNKGQIWQPARKDWVHETGLDIDNRQAVMISGIYIGDTFYDTNTVGTYAYKLDYRNR